MLNKQLPFFQKHSTVVRWTWATCLFLANILHRAGLYNDALIATNMALEISPKFVVTHFTMANIYVSKVRKNMGPV